MQELNWRALKAMKRADRPSSQPRKSKGWRKHVRELAWRTRKELEKKTL